MPAFRRHAIAAALVGLASLAACGPTPASHPGAAKSWTLPALPSLT